MPGAIGLTEDGESGYRVTIDLDLVIQRYGPAASHRTVLHELGHVVDHALLDRRRRRRARRRHPRRMGLRRRELGRLRRREERFAESFAKWALDDIGVSLDIGYRVPPPAAPLDVWGAPLARLAAG